MQVGLPPSHRTRSNRQLLALLPLSLVLGPFAACEGPPGLLEDGGAGGASGFPDAGFDSVSPWADRDGMPFETGGGMDASGDGGKPDPSQFNCPEVPTAYVLEYADPFSGVIGEAASLLAAAGFDVQPLPLDRDPRELRGLIFLGSFVSENPDYAAYVLRNATALYTFVDAANVLVEMTQADQTEPRPPFLPNSQSARRTDTDVGTLFALDAQHPLLAGVPLDGAGNLVWQSPRLG